jgi:tripartite-type tricarboxylate transporter receptor subunit TctC
MIFARQDMAYPIVAPPETPPERVAVLREAFQAVMQDPEFLADAKKARLDMAPLTGEEMEKIVDRTYKLDKKLVARLKEILK